MIIYDWRPVVWARWAVGTCSFHKIFEGDYKIFPFDH